MKKISTKEASRHARKYPLSVCWSDEDQVFVGSIPGLIGDCCHGNTPEEVIPQLKDIAEDLVTFLIQKGQLLPPIPKLFARHCVRREAIRFCAPENSGIPKLHMQYNKTLAINDRINNQDEI